jgi:RNA-directed DNA polymerase
MNPPPARHVEVLDDTAGTHTLGIPTVLDPVIQEEIAQVLVSIFNPGFSESSYGFCPGLSAEEAVRKVREYTQAGDRIAVDMDLSNFLDASTEGSSLRRKESSTLRTCKR